MTTNAVIQNPSTTNHNEDSARPADAVIEVSNLSLKLGSKRVLNNLTFHVPRGRVTLLAGPNGAGKSSALQTICGLNQPTSGKALINDRVYAELPEPSQTVGALLGAEWLDPALSARANLRILSQLAGLPDSRVDESLSKCGIFSVADQKVGEFSLGMRQRCGIAAAMLHDPEVLILDEPVNGLDPNGMTWLRGSIREHTEHGGTTLLSSHFLSDSERLAEHLVIMGKGETLWEGELDELTHRGTACTLFRSTDDEAVVAELWRHHQEQQNKQSQQWRDPVTVNRAIRVAATPLEVSAAARSVGVDLLHLEENSGSLEEEFHRITEGAVEFK